MEKNFYCKNTPALEPDNPEAKKCKEQCLTCAHYVKTRNRRTALSIHKVRNKW